MTKIEKSQYIVQALYVMKTFPAKDDRRVIKMARKSSETINAGYRAAVKVIAERLSRI